MTPTLGFTGDVMLGRTVDQRQRRRDAAAVWGDRLGRLRSLDCLLVNLECCLSTRGSPYTDTYHPFHFRADPDWAAPALSAAGVDWACLANNHVLDYGPEAFEDTLAALDDAGVAHAGAGRDAAAAIAPSVLDVDGLDVALVAFTDNVGEWAAAPAEPGVAHVRIDRDDAAVRRTVRDALAAARRHDPDVVVASLHWGPNMTEGPDAARRSFGRWLVDEGVDVVHGHSAHVFHGIEVRDGGLLLYDTGDFVDDYAVDGELRNDRGFLFVVEVVADGTIERLRLEPVRIGDCAVHAASGSVAAWCRETMRERTRRFDLGTTYDRAGDGLVVDVG